MIKCYNFKCQKSLDYVIFCLDTLLNVGKRDLYALSIRDGAKFQSFYDDFVFVGSESAKRLQIGNAVPPLVSIALTKAMQDYFYKNYVKYHFARFEKGI